MARSSLGIILMNYSIDCQRVKLVRRLLLKLLILLFHKLGQEFSSHIFASLRSLNLVSVYRNNSFA